MQDNKSSSLYALLIAIDCYLPNKLPNNGYYPSLGGCVSDINRIENFLTQKIGLVSDNILKLTASNSGKTEPAETPDKWPTYKNIVEAFNQVIEKASSGDQVCIYYSGHGGRTNTAYPKLKGEDGLDETLVPTDIGNSEARYLRDIEIAHLLKKMVDKGLIVTMILDSCHSGGATRGNVGAATRGISEIDTTKRPTDSLVASTEELSNTWSKLNETSKTRNIESGSGWLPESKRYVLLAACRPNESAIEDKFGDIRSGVLTYYFLESIAKQIGSGFTYKTLHDQVIANVHSKYPSQTPLLEGDADRIVFGSDHVQPAFAVNVMDINHENNEVLLSTGQSQGVKKGAQFAIYPSGVTDFRQVDKRLAIVEITKLGASDSWAKITAEFGQQGIEQGAQAVLVDLGSVNLERKIVLSPQSNDIVPSSIKQSEALEQIKSAIPTYGKGFILLATGGNANEKIDYQVAVNPKGEFEIWDSTGAIIQNLNPPINISDTNAAARVIQRLVHLAKYSNVLQLDNYDSQSPLAGKLAIELSGLQPNFELGDQPELQHLPPSLESGNVNSFNEGTYLALRVQNNSSRVLNVTVLDLQPDWGITQIYPPASDSYFMPIDPGKYVIIPLKVSLSQGYKEGKDVIKVFATVGPTNFRWLELPVLDQSMSSKSRTRSIGGTKNPLEGLMAKMAEDIPKTRNVDTAPSASYEWTTSQIEIKIQNK
jgi:caspase domain-containing protein